MPREAWGLWAEQMTIPACPCSCSGHPSSLTPQRPSESHHSAAAAPRDGSEHLAQAPEGQVHTEWGHRQRRGQAGLPEVAPCCQRKQVERRK